MEKENMHAAAISYTGPITVKGLREFFARHYSYISLQLTDAEIASYIEQPHIARLPLCLAADCLSDYILANGLGDVQE